MSIEERLRGAGLGRLPRTAWLELDLDALTGNLGVLRELAGPAAVVRPVVKADAYGHGAVAIARALEAAGADGFCVAAIDEAIELRAGGVRGPILVLYPVDPGWVAEAAAGGIALAAGDPILLRGLLDAVAAVPPDRPLEVELEVETGLGRGGVTLEGLAAAARDLAASPGIRLTGLWTHLQAAEDAAITAVQLERFGRASAVVGDAGLPPPGRHVAASGGLLVDGVAALDGVRPGLSVYGIVPDELDPASLPAAVARLRPVMSLHARPVRVLDLPAGWGISYGPTYRTGRPSRIATLPLGYGDGWSRRLSNRAEALVRGRRAPIVGNVAMDAIMVDVTDVPGQPVTVADELVLLGTQGGETISALDVARSRTTNTWEVVTNMARRLPRVYHAAAGPLELRTLVRGEDAWLESNSGTATSATSRSTRS